MDQISVIVPVHNGAAYLEACIDSILAQDYEALEVLIINDGSKDDTAAVCERLRGLPDVLAAKEKVIVPRIELSPEMAEELDRRMHLITKGKMTTVVYFNNGEYIKITGLAARIDETSRILQIVNTKIRFEDILQVE